MSGWRRSGVESYHPAAAAAAAAGAAPIEVWGYGRRSALTPTRQRLCKLVEHST